jgi:hypothetical protein
MRYSRLNGCLHRYEASEDLSDAILNTWLVNLRGHKYIECDWTQEDYNKYLVEMVEDKGDDFNDHFYRHTLAPNIMHFHRMKEKMETAFDLKHEGKTHGAPHVRNKFQYLLQRHKKDPMHLFRSGRGMGHATVNFYARGYELKDGRIAILNRDSIAYSGITKDEQKQSTFDRWQLEKDPMEDSDFDCRWRKLVMQ